MFLTRPFGAFLMAALLLSSAASAEHGDSTCKPHQDAAMFLGSKYGESVVLRALNTTNKMFEVYANLDTGTFTLVLTDPGGESCLVDSGEAARIVDEAIEEGPET